MEFKRGARFVRIDLHLHTKSDKEFKSENWKSEEDFAIKFVEQLEGKNIKIAAITNHNQFAREEYLTIKKIASEKNILVLPGIEVSVNEGKSGIHVLCIFPEESVDPEGLETQCKIEKFITLMYPSLRFDEDGNPLTSEKSLRDMVDILEKELKCRYMIIPAHVNNSKGLFKELSFGSIIPFIDKDWMRKRIVAFQNINETTIEKFEAEVHKVAQNKKIRKQLLIPAYIEASDPKDMESVGCRYSCIKLGELSFEALYFALGNHELRMIKKEEEIEKRIHQIKRIEFLTHKGLEKSSVQFSPFLNNFIGIRGSGKSTIIEAVRYAFEIEPGDDKEYKESLIREHLGSGGKVIVNIEDKVGNCYRIERVLNQRAKVYDENDEFCAGLRPYDIMPITYYGQKDLQMKMKEPGLQMGFIDEYIHSDIKRIENKITEKKEEIKKLMDEIKRLSKKIEKKDEMKEKLVKAEKDIKDFNKLGVADKLKLEAAFKKDEIMLKKVKAVLEEVEGKRRQYESDIFDIIGSITFSESEHNQDLFTKAEEFFAAYKKQLEELCNKMAEVSIEAIQENKLINDDFDKRKEAIAEKIAEIKRTISVNELSVDNYSKLIEERDKYNTALKEIEKYDEKLKKMEEQKEILLEELEKLWHRMFMARSDKAAQINQKQGIIKIEVQYKNDKKSYYEFLKDEIFKGSGLRADKLNELIDKYPDGIEILGELFNNNGKGFDFLSESQLQKFKECCKEKEYELCTYKVPDTIKIYYKNKPIEHLSLGQRASSLLMLLLSVGDSPLVMDQPEDDLDNEMIYEGLIKELLALKNKRQVIFATHNSNIPVLGDCDQGIVCSFDKDKFSFQTGSIDTKLFQEKIIAIMEGGEEAFQKRKAVYEKWMS